MGKVKRVKEPWTWGKSQNPRDWQECVDAMKSLKKRAPFHPPPPKEKPHG